MSHSLARPRAAADIEVRGAASLEEESAANQLFARVQALGREQALAWLESAGAAWPGHRPERVRLALRSGQVVGALRVAELTLRIGRARLRVGGIGWVSTHPDFRMQGVCAALMTDTLNYLGREGFALSLLFGIPGLYQKFGYVAAIPARSIRIDLTSVPSDSPPRHACRPFTDADIPAMCALFDAEEANEASYSIVRTEAWTRAQALSRVPKTPHHADWPATISLVDARGRFSGWLMPESARDELVIKDTGVADEEACASLLAHAAALAREQGVERIRFLVPPFHRFARYLEPMGSTEETGTFRDSDGMLALVDARAALAAMLPEWNRRLEPGLAANAREGLAFTCAGSGFRVRVGSDGIELATGAPDSAALALTGAELVLLLGGCRRAPEILADRWAGLTEPEQRTAQFLFPRLAPFIWPIDHF